MGGKMFKKIIQFFLRDKNEFSQVAFEQGFEDTMSDEAAALIQSVESGTLTNEQLLDIIRDHSHNVTEECDVCYEIGEECFYDLYEQVFDSYKPTLSSELVNALASNYEWEPAGEMRTPYRHGVYESRMLNFVLHPMSSFEHLLNSAEYFSQAVHHDWVNDSIEEEDLEDHIIGNLKAVLAHPKANDEILALWKDAVHEFLSDLPMVCEPGPAADCEHCESLIQMARQTASDN
jgi:hypothetical protein